MTRRPFLLLSLLPVLFAGLRPASAEVAGGKFEVLFEREFDGYVTVLGATDQFLFLSNATYAPADNRPEGIARMAKDGSVEGYSPNVRQHVISLLLCDLNTGNPNHEFRGPMSRRPRISGFEIALTSPPVMLEDGFAFLTADWRLQRIRLNGADGKPERLWDLDIPIATKQTPRVNDDVGYLLPAITRCDDTLVFTFNGAPAPAEVPVHIHAVVVNLADGKIRWTGALGLAGAIDRSPTCLSAGSGKFRVATATGDIQTFSLGGNLLHAFRLADSGEYRPIDPQERWRGENWDLFPVSERQIILFAGESPEFGRDEPSPVCSVHVAPDGAMTRLWQTSQIRRSAAPAASGVNFYLTTQEGITAYALDTGKPVWTEKAEDSLHWAGPLVHAGLVYFPHGYGIEVLRDLPVKEHLGQIRFQTIRKNSKSTHMPNNFCPPVIHGGILYAATDSKVYALKLPLFP